MSNVSLRILSLRKLHLRLEEGVFEDVSELNAFVFTPKQPIKMNPCYLIFVHRI